MASQAELKQIASLRLSKFRQKYGQFTVEGRKGVQEVFHSELKVCKILTTQTYVSKNKVDFPHEIVSESDYARISQFDTPPGILAVVEMPASQSWNKNQPLTIALDGISDPGNLGTIIRIADWYGLTQLLLSNDCVDVYNHKCLSATMGSFTRVQCLYVDLSETLTEIPVLGAFLDGDSIYQIKMEQPAVLLIGSESHGIRPALEKIVTKRMTIPRLGQAESLNAGVATAILVDRLMHS